MLVAGKAYLVRTLMNDKELCGANYERNVRDGQVQVPTGPRARRRSGRPGHGTGQRLRSAGPADLRRDELPAGRVVAVVEHQEREHSEARDAGDRVVDAAAQIVPDAAIERPRRLHGTQEDWRPAYGSFPQPTGPERGPHRRPGVLEGRIRDRGLRPP